MNLIRNFKKALMVAKVEKGTTHILKQMAKPGFSKRFTKRFRENHEIPNLTTNEEEVTIRAIIDAFTHEVLLELIDE